MDATRGRPLLDNSHLDTSIKEEQVEGQNQDELVLAPANSAPSW
jgi:hypothetical protein